MVDRCVCCGAMIPEGRMVCLMCEKKANERRKAMCDHGRLRTVGDRVFCCECGEELPLDFLINGKKPAEKPAPAEKTNKAPARKRTAKKAV